MRAYTLSVLQKLAGSSQPIKDSEIVDWTNTTLAEAGKSSSITGFKDPAITTSMPVIDLIDAIKPGAIKYELVGSGTSDEVRTYKNYNWNPTFSDIPHYLQCCRSHESEGGLDAQKKTKQIAILLMPIIISGSHWKSPFYTLPAFMVHCGA